MTNLSYFFYSPDESTTPVRENIRNLFQVPMDLFKKNSLLLMKDQHNIIVGAALVDPADTTQTQFFGAEEQKAQLTTQLRKILPSFV
jgi:hypothetical protein